MQPEVQPEAFQNVFHLMVGIGLAAACGFRVFVPLLAASAAALSGQLRLSPGFEWIGTQEAFAAFLVATILEIGAYYVPWIDNMLDAVAGPAAVVAGTVATAAFFDGGSPLLTWSAAAIAGGGTAGVVQVGTTVVRAASTATTGGLGNPVVSTGEAAGATAMSALAVFVPFVAAGVALLVVFFALRFVWRRMHRRRADARTAAPTGTA